MNIDLVPVKPTMAENALFLSVPECDETLEMTVRYYARIGYSVPWIGYFARLDGVFVGSAGFKGRPLHGKVEIAYVTFSGYRNRGIGTAICGKLVELARATDPRVIITARTLREESYSTRILKRNNFVKKGTVVDPEDGKVWEWTVS